MAGKLSNVTSRILGGNDVVPRSVASSLRQRSDMGFPVGKHIGPKKPLPASYELFGITGLCFLNLVLIGLLILFESTKLWLGC